MTTQAAHVAAPAEEYRRIPLKDLQESKTNPRRHWDKVADAELADSIKQQGVIEPIIVRQLTKEGPTPWDSFEVVAGTRRFRASKAAGRDTIPAIIRELTDVQAREIQIVENLQRKDVHPLDEA